MDLELLSLTNHGQRVLVPVRGLVVEVRFVSPEGDIVEILFERSDLCAQRVVTLLELLTLRFELLEFVSASITLARQLRGQFFESLLGLRDRCVSVGDAAVALL